MGRAGDGAEQGAREGEGGSARRGILMREDEFNPHWYIVTARADTYLPGGCGREMFAAECSTE